MENNEPKNLEKWEIERNAELKVSKEVVEFLKAKDLTFDKAIRILKNAQSRLERASLGNKL